MKHAIMFVAAVTIAATSGLWLPLSPLHAQDAAPAVDPNVTVARPLVDTYELMDFMMDPVYEELKDAVAAEPTGRAGWRAIYVAAFTLGEQANLLFSRTDQDYMKTPEWAKATVDMREKANAIGLAVRNQDYAAAKAGYAVLIESCNACHKQFEPEAPVVEP